MWVFGSSLASLLLSFSPLSNLFSVKVSQVHGFREYSLEIFVLLLTARVCVPMLFVYVRELFVMFKRPVALAFVASKFALV